jgi:hypothetical protein
MAQQTAVEWLWNEIDNLIPYQDINKAQQFNGLLEQAKAMEKEQIKNAWYNGGVNGMGLFETNTGEEYYNKNYKNEG